MRCKTLLVLLFFIVRLTLPAASQCMELGQTPASAFPVCGTSVFHQDSVPPCMNGYVLPAGCKMGGDHTGYTDINPFWYKFTCFKAGQLVLTITPDNLNDDYDWQLFDVTGRPLRDIFLENGIARKLCVTFSWSGYTGVTGTSLTTGTLFACAGSEPLIVKAPALIEGHNYLLMVSHWSGDKQSGYNLSFGGTAVITDSLPPRVQSAQINCAATKIGIKLNKKLSCASLAPDGSDFYLSTPLAKIIAAKSFSCSSGFDMDSAIVTLSNPLPDGSYTIYTQKGSDGNTLLDACGTEVPEKDSALVTFQTGIPIYFDSISPVGCAPDNLTFVFKRSIQCSSVASDGSDFEITGSYPVKVIGAISKCIADSDYTGFVVNIQLDSKLYKAGNFQVKLVRGNDGNSIIDECGLEILPGQVLNFSTSDTVNADFYSNLALGCRGDTLTLQHNGIHTTNWQWLFSDGVIDTTQNVTRVFKDYGLKGVTLTVGNDQCLAAAYKRFNLDNQLTAQINAQPQICPEDKAVFIDSTIGRPTSWQWTFGNGTVSTSQNPEPQGYAAPTRDRTYLVQLIVRDNQPCADTTYKPLTVLYTCYIAVAGAFTPNGDGLNDYLYPINAYKSTNLEFKVFNRMGQEVFTTKDWTHKWDGTFKGQPQPTGVYVWFLSYTSTDTGVRHFTKGTTVLIR